MLKKIIQPKVLSIITIISTIIGFVLSIISNIIFQNGLSGLDIIGIIVSSLFDLLIYGGLYTIIYLLIILKKKEKNMKILNIILFVNLVIATIIYIVRQINYINDIYSISLSITSGAKFQIWYGLISNVLFRILEIIIIYGILKKKKMPYKIFMIILIVLSFANIKPFITSVYSYLKYSTYITYSPILLILFNLLAMIIGIINSISFILFIYLYGKSINERSRKNE